MQGDPLKLRKNLMKIRKKYETKNNINTLLKSFYYSN